MIRFAPQAAQKATATSRVAPEPESAGVKAAAVEPLASAVMERADEGMLLVGLPEISAPTSIKVRKARGEKKSKHNTEALTVQLALDA